MQKGGDRLKFASKGRISQNPVTLHYVLLVLIALSLIISISALINTNEIKKMLVGNVVDIEDFLGKLTAHEEMDVYLDVSPLNVIQINQNNYANLQNQIAGLDLSFLGSFIVQYPDRIVIFDYENDAIKGLLDSQQQAAKLPPDFSAKLLEHEELKGLEQEQPVIGQIDEPSLQTLKQKFPDAYADVNIGDFLLRYQTKLVIYDYEADRIVNEISLAQD